MKGIYNLIHLAWHPHPARFDVVRTLVELVRFVDVDYSSYAPANAPASAAVEGAMCAAAGSAFRSVATKFILLCT